MEIAFKLKLINLNFLFSSNKPSLRQLTLCRMTINISMHQGLWFGAHISWWMQAVGELDWSVYGVRQRLYRPLALSYDTLWQCYGGTSRASTHMRMQSLDSARRRARRRIR